jgi:hypothetical protein
MRKRRAILVIGLEFCSAIAAVDAASAQAMTYRQTKAETRAAIITYLKGLN